MSKRHQSNRRKSYGRRQHELHERHQRDREPEDIERALDDAPSGSLSDGFSFMDPHSPRLRYALGD